MMRIIIGITVQTISTIVIIGESEINLFITINTEIPVTNDKIIIIIAKE